jgi:hypothetical protein
MDIGRREDAGILTLKERRLCLEAVWFMLPIPSDI